MKARILIVDDEESIRFTFETFLKQQGHDVVTARSYAETVVALDEATPDVVFTDIILGDRSGSDILSEVKKRGLVCPVLLITGQPNVETAAEAVRQGAFDYVPKPIQKDELIRLTNLALQHKSITDDRRRLEREKEDIRQKLEATFRSVRDGILTVDNEGKIIAANEAIAGFCGMQPQAVLGQKYQGVPTGCQGACLKVLDETLQTNKVVREFRVECRHDLRPFQVAELTCSPLKDSADAINGAVLVIRDITRLNQLERQLKKRYHYGNIVGKSIKMQEVFDLMDDLGDAEANVLITGETGTGKELVAKALHQNSSRAFQALVTVNCAALAESLLVSELFGHVKGAFTGALNDKIGRFQLADGGSIFLDEIGDVSQDIQLKLLRVLQEGTFERVGESETNSTNVRVIAATNRDLKELVNLGQFREDLYYRLKVVEVNLPSLRERIEDIPLLVRHFCDEFSPRFKKHIDGVSDDALRALSHYPWPGNVRELMHAIEHAFVVCHRETITVDHMPPEIKEYALMGASPLRRTSDQRQRIVRALEHAGWNKAEAARMLGISRPTLYQRIRELNITRQQPVNA